jgi:acetate---CoA ligase (ADP-forming)
MSADLKRFFHPESIALVGVSQDFTTIGGKPFKNLISHKYQGKIYPINPKYQEIAGYRCYPSLLAVPGSIDVALLAVSQAKTLQILKECAEKNIKFVVLFTAGFAEIGQEGERLQNEILQFAQEAGIRIIGPNSQGSINVKNSIPMGFSITFEAETFLPGHVGLVSQSGDMGFAVFAAVQEEKIGFSYAVTLGNQMDLNVLDFLSFMLEDEETNLIAGYIEGIHNGEQFIRLAKRSHLLRKPLILYKAGRSEAGRNAAMSHTASLTGSYETYLAVSRQYGVINVDDEKELIDAIKIFSHGKYSQGSRVAVITTSGASGIMIADHCDRIGLEMASFSEGTKKNIKEIIPLFGSALNPVDITAQVINDPNMFRRTLQVLADANEVDIIVVTLQAGRELLRKLCNELIEIDAKISKPIVVTLSGSNEIVGEGRELLKNNGVPVYDSTYRTVLAIRHLVHYSQSIQKMDHPDAIKPITNVLDEEFRSNVQPESGGVWTEEKAKKILQGLGIPVPKGILIKNKDELIHSYQNLKFPVVAKVISADIPHKSDVGAVQLGIQDFNQLLESYDRIIGAARRHVPHAVIRGVLIEEMIAEKGVEMLIGVKRDPQFGPIIVCGLGGIFVEVFRDVSIRHAPVDFSNILLM